MNGLMSVKETQIAPVVFFEDVKNVLIIKQLELDELKEKVADQRIDLESSRWYQTVQSDSIIKLRTEVEEREKLNYEAKGIITNQRSEIEKLRGLLKECLRYIDIWGYTDSHENLLYPQIKVALGESEEK